MLQGGRWLAWGRSEGSGSSTVTYGTIRERAGTGDGVVARLPVVMQWKWPRSWALGLRGLRSRGAGSAGGEDPVGSGADAAPTVTGSRRRGERWRWWLAGLGGGAVLVCLVLLFALGPLLKSRAIAEAAKRGVELDAARVRAGWMSATLYDVSLQPIGVSALRARFATVRVGIGGGLGLRELEVADGTVEVDGSVEVVLEQVERWRKEWRGRARASEGTSASAGPSYRAAGVGLVWKNAFEPGDEQRWAGLQFERTQEVQQVGLDHVALEHPRGTVELAGLKALWRREAGAERLVEASIAEARVKANLGGDDAGATAARTRAPDDVDGSDAARRAAEARADTAPTTAEEAGGLTARLPAVDPDRGARWQRLLGRLVGDLIERLPEQARVNSLWLELERGEQRLHLGPSTLTLDRGAEALAVALTPQGETKGTPLSVRATVPRSGKGFRLAVEGGPVSLSTLGVREGDFGLVGVGQAEVGGVLEVELTDAPTSVQDAAAHGAQDTAQEGLRDTAQEGLRDTAQEGLRDTVEAEIGPQLKLRVDARLAHLTVQSDRLAPRPVSVRSTRLSGKGQVDLGGTRYALEEAELQVGEAAFRLEGVLERGADHVAVQFRGGTPLIACQTLLDSAPRGLLDRVEQTRMQGTLALDVGVAFDSRKPADMKVRWDLKNACRITDVPPSLAPERFGAPFQHEVVGPDNSTLLHETGPGTINWTPIDGMVPYLESAVLVCEDGRFFRHDGFDARAIESSIQMNVRAGRFVRGASTVSMQLAKNLYLSREKQMSRKLQEAVLTMLLEQRLSKRELLELYFNIVELGPGVYGIRQAAQHYFATTPDQLTLAQSFFLVSILPSPTRQFFDAEGRLNAGRAAYVRQLLRIAHERGRITDAELELGLTEELRFGVPYTREEAAGFDDFSEHDPEFDVDGPATRTAPPVDGSVAPGVHAPAPAPHVPPPPATPPPATAPARRAPSPSSPASATDGTPRVPPLQ